MGTLFQSNAQTTPEERRQAIQQMLQQHILGNYVSPASASLGQMGQVDDLWAKQRAYDQQHATHPQNPGQPPQMPPGGDGALPTDLDGLGQLAGGLAQWRQRQPDQQFPSAPGGAPPSFMNSFRNRFGNNGGLY